MLSPHSKLKQCWDDETKITVLFSPMRDRDLNPKSWEQKINFWSDAILSDCLEGREAIIDIENLKIKYKRKGKSPSCLSNVLEEMLRTKQIQKLSDVTQVSNSGWLSWGYNRLVRAPIGWGLKLIPWQTAETETKPEQYVVMDVIKSKAGELLDRHFQCEDRLDIIDYTDLQQQSADLCPTEVEFMLVMQHLCQSKQVVVQETEGNVKLVKFMMTDGRTKTVEKIDEQEMRIHKIRQAHVEVKKQIEKLSAEIARLAQEALAAKKAGAQKNALRLMKRRALTQQRVEQLSGSQDLLEDILYRIQQAGSNEMIVRAIEGGNAILKDLTSKTSEDVNRVMDEFAELQEDQNDVTTFISTALPGVEEPSHEDLESELDDLLTGDSPKVPEKAPQTPQGEKVSPKRIGFSTISDKDQGSPTTDELKEIEALLDDLQLPDVPTFSPGQGSPRQGQARGREAALQM